MSFSSPCADSDSDVASPAAAAAPVTNFVAVLRPKKIVKFRNVADPSTAARALFVSPKGRGRGNRPVLRPPSAFETLSDMSTISAFVKGRCGAGAEDPAMARYAPGQHPRFELGPNKPVPVFCNDSPYPFH